MALGNLNFRGSGKTLGGKFTPASARRVLQSQFKDLTLEARNYFSRELGRGRMIHGADFDKIVTEAHKRGLISSTHAEQIKDVVKLPDEFNEHWK
ncbi:MAG: hypothetical protein NT136_04090 [Candidatus Moranbacteria bacterium]|nr:hypothetical protein [Candidatus Moranbacteria bacterium]